MVCCDNGTIDTFEIALTDKPFKTTSIGVGWETFYATSEFFAEDVLYFKFTIFVRSHVARVCKITL
jgi:hypothetical protein